MNEEHDINLPLDADDLSKHAPALFALKGTEEGFVVPALYFEELSELVVSKTCIPEDGGLVVPENYFEESVERFVDVSSIDLAQSGKDNSAGLVVPENYFEELPSEIESKASLSNFDFAVSGNAGLVTPENYFEEFGANLESHIALDNLKQDEGFVLPEKYFEKLTEKVIAETTLDKSEVNNDEVPAGYFDSLADQVIARIESEEKKESHGRVIVLAQWKKYAAITAVAASVALLIALAWTFIGKDDNGDGSMQYAYEPNNLVPENYVNVNPPKPIIDTVSSTPYLAPEGIARELPKNPEEIKRTPENQVIENDDIIAHTDLMDEALAMDFVMENGMIEETENVLDPAMMEYLMNDNTSLDVFGPTE